MTRETRQNKTEINFTTPKTLFFAITISLIVAVLTPTSLALPENNNEKGVNKANCSDQSGVSPQLKDAQERAQKLQQRSESFQKLKQLSSALILYLNDHEGKYPDNLEAIKPYDDKNEILPWALENVAYLGQGKSATIAPQAPIAYDKTLLNTHNGVNIIFNDSHVEFIQKDKLKNYGIDEPFTDEPIKKPSEQSKENTKKFKEIFLPDVEKTPVALDLTSGELIEIHCSGEIDFDNPDFIRALKELKEGDLIYDNHGFVCLKGTQITEKPIFENDIPFPWYKIPKFLPYAAIVTTIEGQKYNLNVTEIKKECRLLYSPLSVGDTGTDTKPFLFSGVASEKEIEIAASSNNLWELGNALSVYAGDHDDKFPKTLEEIRSYFEDEKGFDWCVRNVSYIGEGKTGTTNSQIPIAYDKTLLKTQNGTTVLFANFRVEFVQKDKLKDYGIDSHLPVCENKKEQLGDQKH